MFRAIPGVLELGTLDHIIHLLLGDFVDRRSFNFIDPFEKEN
jgi:hypothetical protein